MSTPNLSSRDSQRGRNRASSRNRLDGTVLAIRKDALAAEVELSCGPYRIVSLMSRDAADELDLKPGDPAIAIVKSAAVFIERHDRSPLAAVTQSGHD